MIKFDDLVQAPPPGITHFRNTRTNPFKGRIKKTQYKIFWGQHTIPVECSYDDRNKVTALVSGKKSAIKKGKKIHDR